MARLLILEDERVLTRHDDASKIRRQLGLGGNELRLVQEYLVAPTPKAMSLSPSAKRAFHQYDVAFGLAASRAAAMSHCEKAKNADCRIVMENKRRVGPMAQ